MTIEQPAASGRHDLPHADHQREIPRNDARHHPDRLFLVHASVTRPLRERDRNVQRPAADLGGQPRGVAHPVQGAADLKGAGDGNGFPLLEGFQLRQLFAVLLHQIGKTQQDAFTVSRGAPGPAAIDKSAPGRTSPPGRHPPGWRRRWWQSPARWPDPRRLTGFRSARRRGAVDIQAMLTV